MSDFITVEQAENIIQSHTRDYGVEKIPFESAIGRILAEDIVADRDLPPFNRPTMDGIAIQYSAFQKGIRSFKIKATQAAGENPVNIEDEKQCVEIMTGAALHETVDTIVRYEDIEIKDGTANIIISTIKKGQNIHSQGKDKKQAEKVADANILIMPAVIGLAASVGKIELAVKKLPKVVIITTGYEMVSADTTPNPYQLRRSNDYTIKAVLLHYGIKADTIHLNDNYSLIKERLNHCLDQYDVILISGGVSKGKFDYVPRVLQELNVQKLFHKVKQRPGKPFWFGAQENNALVFAFPGNPVSAFMCLHRYFLPWLKASQGLSLNKETYAVLNSDVTFSAPLQYFMQVRLLVDTNGQLMAEPIEGNGSGDFTNLIYTDAFMELPLEKNEFKKGEVYKAWKYTF